MLSKTAEYALRAVACMGGDAGQPASADLLAEKTKVPRRYLTRVLQDLVAADLARSQSGPGGGYELACDPGDLTILDVVNAVAPVERIRQCPLGLKSHSELCPLHAELDRVDELGLDRLERLPELVGRIRNRLYGQPRVEVARLHGSAVLRIERQVVVGREWRPAASIRRQHRSPGSRPR